MKEMRTGFLRTWNGGTVRLWRSGLRGGYDSPDAGHTNHSFVEVLRRINALSGIKHSLSMMFHARITTKNETQNEKLGMS